MPAWSAPNGIITATLLFFGGSMGFTTRETQTTVSAMWRDTADDQHAAFALVWVQIDADFQRAASFERDCCTIR